MRTPADPELCCARRARPVPDGLRAPKPLARGIDDFEHARYTAAIQELKAVQPQLPKLADYVAFYLASSRMELKDYTGALQDLAAFHHLSTASPLTLKAALMEARALCESGSPAGAIA